MDVETTAGSSGTILVTGGCGFIGSHVVSALTRRGVRVRVLDDLSTGRRDNLPADVEVVEGDVSDYETVRRAMVGARGCVHLAAIASVARSSVEWAATSRVNLGGTVNVLDAARAAEGGPPIPVVYASSAAVYGGAPASAINEAQATNPLSAYGADKRAGELHAAVAARLHGIPCVCLRFFNVYGPRQDPSSAYSGVISRFADAIFRRAPIDLHGDGGQTRDFVFVEDVVEAILRGLDAAPRLPASVFNVCTGNATSIRALAEIMHENAGAEMRINPLPAREGDIRVSLGDPSNAREQLGWKASTPLAVGLARTLAWYREQNPA